MTHFYSIISPSKDLNNINLMSWRRENRRGKVTLRKIWVCQMPKTLGKDRKTLSKGFAKCTPSANGVGIETTGKELKLKKFMAEKLYISGKIWREKNQNRCRVYLHSTLGKEA